MERELIERCLRQDAASQKKLYDTYASRMFTLCLRYAGDYHLAEDILQDGFVKVFTHLHQFRFEGSLEGWIRRVMVSEAVNAVRKKIKMVALEKVEVEEEKEPDNGLWEHLSAPELMNVIQGMPSGYRTVFNLYVFEQYSHQEIARELEISEGTSKSQLAKARKFLQEKISALKNLKIMTHE